MTINTIADRQSMKFTRIDATSDFNSRAGPISTRVSLIASLLDYGSVRWPSVLSSQAWALIPLKDVRESYTHSVVVTVGKGATIPSYSYR